MKFQHRIIALLLSFLLLISAVPVAAAAADTDAFRVVISVEGLTLGQGIYVEPTIYTIDQINTLLAPEGYGPYTKRNLTAGMATLAMLKDKGLDYTILGDWGKFAYLKSIKGVDTGKLDIPLVITNNGGPSNTENDGNKDAYLGEYDYSEQSGWMITVNDFMIDGAISKFGLENNNTRRNKDFNDYGNTYVIRWQFTLWGYGLDLGYQPRNVTTGEVKPYFTHANKDMLYLAYAESADANAKAAALSVMQNLTAAQSDVDNMTDKVNNPNTVNNTDSDTASRNFFRRIADFFRNILNFFRSIFSR
ncbi:MAG: hypothetical protein IJ766_05895 [Clostridia bacterium]|nr:hypothetical protein [Clostridia bacterium]